MINKAIGAAQFDDEEDIKSALFPPELIDAGVSPSDLAQADQSQVLCLRWRQQVAQAQRPNKII